jgi:hypothetical protein
MRIFIIWYIKIQNKFLALLASVLFKKIKNPDEIKKILLFRTGSIGDSICAIPAIYSIRKNFQSAEITLLTNAGGTNLVSLYKVIDNTLFDRVIDYYSYN